jgi:hypothetical protein
MTTLSNFAAWLATTPLNAAVTQHAWIVPAIQVVHIVAIAVVVIGVALINLRALGLVETDRPQRAVTATWLRPVLGAVAVLALTGVLLIVSEPGRAMFRTVFWVKLGLIVVALAVTATQGRRETSGTLLPRVQAVAALLLWIGVIYAGRWIAYADGWAGAAS